MDTTTLVVGGTLLVLLGYPLFRLALYLLRKLLVPIVLVTIAIMWLLPTSNQALIAWRCCGLPDEQMCERMLADGWSISWIMTAYGRQQWGSGAHQYIYTRRTPDLHVRERCLGSNPAWLDKFATYILGLNLC
jgi:hypothetical protein